MTGTNNLVDNALVGATGTGKFVGNVSPEISTSILDVNGNILLGLSPTGSAVNYINLSNNVTTMAPSLTAAGSDTNIPLTLQCKGTSQIQLGSNGLASLTVASAVASQINYINVAGSATGNAVTINVGGTDSNISLTLNTKGTGGVNITGSTSGSLPTSGYVGQVITHNVPFGSAISLTTATPADIGLISLPAGNWAVYGNVFINGSAVVLNGGLGWCSLTSATQPDASLVSGSASMTTPTYGYLGITCPLLIVNTSTTKNCYLSAFATFATGTATGCGTITAIRLP